MGENILETTGKTFTKEDLKMKKAEKKNLQKEADKIITELQAVIERE